MLIVWIGILLITGRLTYIQCQSGESITIPMRIKEKEVIFSLKPDDDTNIIAESFCQRNAIELEFDPGDTSLMENCIQSIAAYLKSRITTTSTVTQKASPSHKANKLSITINGDSYPIELDLSKDVKSISSDFCVSHMSAFRLSESNIHLCEEPVMQQLNSFILSQESVTSRMQSQQLGDDSWYKEDSLAEEKRRWLSNRKKKQPYK